jgi:hypothetical protein
MQPSAVEGRAILLSPPIIPSDSWIELSFLLVVVGLIPLNLLVRED